MVETQTNDCLEKEHIGKLMLKYAVPCVISMLVAALYNIVDQIFIANAEYLGSYGNAANTVVFPLTVVAIAIAVMIGDGCCTFVSISLGAKRREDACRGVGSSVIAVIAVGIVLMAVYLIFQKPILTAFGGRVNSETFRMSKEYFFWITLGIPFYMFGQALNPIIRSDGSPRFAIDAAAGEIVEVKGNLADNKEPAENDKTSESDSTKTEGKRTSTAATDYIGEEKAKEIVLLRADLSESDITKYSCETYIQKDIPVYKVKFVSNGYEYSCDVNAITGEIVKYDRQPEHTN